MRIVEKFFSASRHTNNRVWCPDWARWITRVNPWAFVVTTDRPRKTWLPDDDNVYVEPETRYTTRRTRKLYDK